MPTHFDVTESLLCSPDVRYIGAHQARRMGVREDLCIVHTSLQLFQGEE